VQIRAQSENEHSHPFIHNEGFK